MSKFQKIDLRDFLTSPLRDEETTSIITNLFNRFLSEEKSVRINGQIGKKSSPNVSDIDAPDFDREQNALVPALYFKTGSEENVFTFDDMLNRFQAMGIDTNNLDQILAEQNFNFVPPISLDKFINYSNYYWLGQTNPLPTLTWNLDVTPEYYVQARPARNSIYKMPVRLATTRDIKLWGKDRPREKVRVTFTSSNAFVIIGDQGTLLSRTTNVAGTENTAAKTLDSLIANEVTTVFILAPDITSGFSGGYGVGDASTANDELFSFTITNGTSNFQAGDYFEIDIEYISGSSLISFVSSLTTNKGYVSNIVADSRMMLVDGVRVSVGDSILVWNQTNAVENGIYTVTTGKWVRRFDANLTSYLPIGSLVYVQRVIGLTNSGKTFILSSRAADGVFEIDDATTGAIGFTLFSTTDASPVNDWQAYNYWVHTDDLYLFSEEIRAAGIQATRPIIEYSRNLQLNKFVDADGNPASSGIPYTQRKTRLNQLPQFDLYRYDGTHAGKTSSIFFYVEDPDFPIDVVLQKRLKTTTNYDYIFGTGIHDEEGRLLYFKNTISGTPLATIWVPGPTTPAASAINFSSTAPTDKGTVVINSVSSIADNQTWTLTATSSTEFDVVGSRSGNVGEATVGTLFTCDDLTLTISAGTVAFDIDDSFEFFVRGPSTPRYVKKNTDGDIINFPGGSAADVNSEGTWLVPRRMFENLPRIVDDEITLGNLIDHCRSIIKAQDNFEGSSFGINNYRLLTTNVGYGGRIRDYAGNFQLLASALIQKDISPLAILDFAESQYTSALSGIDQFLVNDLAKFIASSNTMSMSAISTSNAHLVALLNHFEQLRAEDQNLRTVYADSTAKVTNWPITLPMMGLIPAVSPTIKFDNELGIDVIVHHDGHVSPLATINDEFQRALALTIVERSDKTKTAGTIYPTAPTAPYARQLWYNSTNSTLYSFDVIADTDAVPTGLAGAYWFRKSDQVLFQWNTLTSLWDVSADPISSRWKVVDTSVVRNSLLLAIEQKLYQSVHPSMVQKLNLLTVKDYDDAEIELAKYSAKFNYDTYAPDYDSANAFTWNYSQAVIAGVPAGTARWHDIYNKYFDQPGTSLPTCRPNLEPWKLLNYATKPAGWDASYADVTNTRLWNNAMWSMIAAARPSMKLCVDTTTDELLAPYTSSFNAASVNALLTVIPAGVQDVYEFGENGPVETVWKKSLEYFYGLARVYFKADPMRFLDKTWGETYFTSSSGQIRVERNLQAPLAPSKFLLHGERHHIINERTSSAHFVGGTYSIGAGSTVKFDVIHVEDNATYFYAYVNDTLIGTLTEGVAFSFTSGNVTFTGVTIQDLGIPFNLGDSFTLAQSTSTFTPILNKKFLGLGQTFTNLLRFNSIDTDQSDAVNSHRGWDVKLVHRIGALIRGDSLSIDAAGIQSLPSTAYSLVLKRSTSIDSKWISALRVQLVQAGTRVINPTNGNYVPMGEGTDWIFRIETYNPQNPTITRFVLDTNGAFQTFNALSKQSTPLAFKRYTDRLSLDTTTTPITITGVQNVLNFIYGYIDYLEEQGWTVNAGDRVLTDDETGRNLDWQLEIEKLVDRVYRGVLPGEGHILNPFMNGLWLKTPVGLMSRYSEVQFIDVTTVQAVFDIAGSAIPVRAIQVIRTDDATVTYSDTPIFSAHAFIDEFEHVIIFNNRISDEIDSTTIYSPFLGLRIDSAVMSYVRQEEVDRKPRFHGYVFVGNDVKRNIVSSVDAIGNYYDATKTFNEPRAAEHALALLGFNKKAYFKDIGTNDATQFNFWRGLIQAKGTNMTIDAFVNYKKFTSASVDEYWAYKLAQYGDNRTRIFPEIKVEVADAIQTFTQLQFYDAFDEDYEPLPVFTQIEQDDDARWFTIDELGKGLSFPAQAIESVLGGITPGYYRLDNIFHNGDGASPKIYLRTTVKDVLGNVVSITDTLATSAKIINSTLAKVTTLLTAPALTSYAYVVKGFTWRNFSKLSPVKLFNYKESTLVKEIALWHPAIGIHAYETLDVINSIDSKDPALYNTTIQTVDNANYVRTKPWGKKEVGRVWWDTSNLGYIPYYDASIFPDRNERNARWGALADWARVNVYEWVESDVPPIEYDELAKDQEGQSDIPNAVRASGRSALKKIYARERIVTIRPIAWSRAAVGSVGVHPTFFSSSKRVYFSNAILFIDAQRLTDAGLFSGRRFGAWKDNKPIGEVRLSADVEYDLGNAVELGRPQVYPTGGLGFIAVKKIPNGRLGSAIGSIGVQSRLTQVTASTYIQHLRMIDSFGSYEDVVIDDWLADSDNDKTILFNDFGIAIQVTRYTANRLYRAPDLTADIIASWVDVTVREGIRFDTLIPLPDEDIFVNDPLDPDVSRYEYGWRAWDIPTQSQLDSDLLFPRNVWFPYIGDQIEITPTPEIVTAMSVDTLTLKNGVAINRYTTSWTDWVELKDQKIEKISNGTDRIGFNRTLFLTENQTIDVNRISLYVNGIQISPKNYVVSGNEGEEVVELLNILDEGSSVLFIYRARQLTEDELAFDSIIEDNPSVQIEYKASYQYTKIDVRSEAGSISGAKYYFWVEDSSVIRPNKSTSILQCKTHLTSGPSQFMTFAKIDDRKNAFDSCVISGLNTYVTNNDTYKLRFIHNETLRDDPEQIALRNVHTEWTLLKKSQNSKIPLSLWNHLTNAAAGEDAGGNPLPSPARVDYDSRNGTRSSYGFEPGQILAATDLVRETIRTTILNTSLEIKIGDSTIPDNITALNFDEADEWFKDAESARETMGIIWATARARQINEIFFAVLEDALANNYEFTDIFKTSLISVYTTSTIEEQSEAELEDGKF